MNFSQPSGGAWLKPADHSGHLLLILKVHDISDRYDSFKDKDVPTARIDFTDLDSDGFPELIEDAMNAHPGIVNKLGDGLRKGRLILGRIAQVPTDKGNPAWILGPYTPGADDIKAGEWLKRHEAGVFVQPQPEAPVTPLVAPASQQQPDAAMAAVLNGLTAEQKRTLGIPA